MSRATVRRVLRAAGIAAVRGRRAPRHRCRRERKAHAGQMIIWDGSPHRWLEERGPQLCLQGAVDDATGRLLAGAHFEEQECSAGYLRVLAAIVRTHGVPWSAYMDRHSSLKRNDAYWTLEEELRGAQEPTQVGRALQALEVEVIYALSPQAKGRVERWWGTRQDRLVSELRLADARRAAAANDDGGLPRPVDRDRAGRRGRRDPCAETTQAQTFGRILRRHPRRGHASDHGRALMNYRSQTRRCATPAPGQPAGRTFSLNC